jgi:chromosome segregation ATPase
MAREATITPEQVATAAEQIKSSGAKPTARAVREALGGGSMATVLKFLQQWQGGQARASEQIDDTLDPGIAKAISNTIAARVQAATNEATSRLADLQAETANLIQENERQAQEIEILQQKIDAQGGDLASALGRVTQLQTELSQVRQERDGKAQEAEQARTELAKATLRLEGVPRLEAEVERLRMEMVESQALAARLHEEAAVAVAKQEAAEQSREKAEKLLIVTQSSLKDAQDGARSATEAAAELRGQLVLLNSKKPQSKPTIRTKKPVATKIKKNVIKGAQAGK